MGKPHVDSRTHRLSIDPSSHARKAIALFPGIWSEFTPDG